VPSAVAPRAQNGLTAESGPDQRRRQTDRLLHDVHQLRGDVHGSSQVRPRRGSPPRCKHEDWNGLLPLHAPHIGGRYGGCVVGSRHALLDASDPRVARVLRGDGEAWAEERGRHRGRRSRCVRAAASFSCASSQLGRIVRAQRRHRCSTARHEINTGTATEVPENAFPDPRQALQSHAALEGVAGSHMNPQCPRCRNVVTVTAVRCSSGGARFSRPSGYRPSPAQDPLRRSAEDLAPTSLQ